MQSDIAEQCSLKPSSLVRNNQARQFEKLENFVLSGLLSGAISGQVKKIPWFQISLPSGSLSKCDLKVVSKHLNRIKPELAEVVIVDVVGHERRRRRRRCRCQQQSSQHPGIHLRYPPNIQVTTVSYKASETGKLSVATRIVKNALRLMLA